MTKLTASIVAKSFDEAIHDINRAIADGAEAIEIRLDYLISDNAQPTGSASENFISRECSRLIENCPLPIIWTVRHVSEGGMFKGSIEEQFDILTKAINIGGNYLDIEYRRWEQAHDKHHDKQNEIIQAIKQVRARGRDVKVILSYHDFEGTYHYIGDIAKRIADDEYADVVKVACKVNNICENFYLLDIFNRTDIATIAIGMGALGTISRILAAKFDAEITFASVGENKSSAPGQLTIRQMREEYNWERINQKTKLAGVLGHPIKHSLSPIMHNRVYRHMDVNVLYLRFDVEGGYSGFATFIDFIRERPEYDFIGLSVTIPHKTNAIEYLQKHSYEIDELAQKIGAVNTIVFMPNGRLAGYNTDYKGILESLKIVGTMELSELSNKKVAVLGAGGVAKAIVAAMCSVGADVIIYNRTESKAKALAEQFNCKYESWSARETIAADIIINGTSIGMLGNDDKSPIEEEIAKKIIKPGMIVFDTVYNPLETRLLRIAKQLDAKTIDGANMLVYQAIEQIKLWLDAWGISYNEISADIMKQAILEKLK